MTLPEDIFFKKIVSLRQGKQTLRFRVSQELFSSHEVDAGTKFLLRTLSGVEVGRKILDVGCGYGPIGLTLKWLDKQRVVHLVDRDALAVAYAKQNAELNQLSSVRVYGSLGYEAVSDKDFDLIASNIPGKMSERAIRHFLLDGHSYLAPHGFMAVVVVNPLRETVSQILSNAPNVTILLQKPAARYTVFHFRFEAEERPSVPTNQITDIYHRDRMTVTAAKLSFPMQTARGLPEFDELGHHTRLLLKASLRYNKDALQKLVVFNPGQGHIAVAAWYLYQPEQIVLVDRDLLSLHFSQHNLLQNGCPSQRIVLRHQVGLAFEGKTADAIIGSLRSTEGPKGAAWTVQQGMAQLGGNGRLLTAANSHLITQLILRLPQSIKVLERKKRKGYSQIVLQKI